MIKQKIFLIRNMHFCRPVISFPFVKKSANQKGLWANNDIVPGDFFLVIYLPLCRNPSTARAAFAHSSVYLKTNFILYISAYRPFQGVYREFVLSLKSLETISYSYTRLVFCCVIVETEKSKLIQQISYA